MQPGEARVGAEAALDNPFWLFGRVSWALREAQQSSKRREERRVRGWEQRRLWVVLSGSWGAAAGRWEPEERSCGAVPSPPRVRVPRPLGMPQPRREASAAQRRRQRLYSGWQRPKSGRFPKVCPRPLFWRCISPPRCRSQRLCKSGVTGVPLCHAGASGLVLQLPQPLQPLREASTALSRQVEAALGWSSPRCWWQQCPGMLPWAGKSPVPALGAEAAAWEEFPVITPRPCIPRCLWAVLKAANEFWTAFFFFLKDGP